MTEFIHGRLYFSHGIPSFVVVEMWRNCWPRGACSVTGRCATAGRRETAFGDDVVHFGMWVWHVTGANLIKMACNHVDPGQQRDHGNDWFELRTGLLWRHRWCVDQQASLWRHNGWLCMICILGYYSQYAMHPHYDSEGGILHVVRYEDLDALLM